MYLHRMCQATGWDDELAGGYNYGVPPTVSKQVAHPLFPAPNFLVLMKFSCTVGDVLSNVKVEPYEK